MTRSAGTPGASGCDGRSAEGEGAPLGPGSLTWRYFGDWRGLLQALWAGSMQNMHPKLGAAVEQYSDFFGERWERLFRSLYPIGGVVFDGVRAERTAREVRRYHRDIRGLDVHGRPYHALEPDVFYWAHATFFCGVLRTAEHFCGGLTEEDKRRLFAEHREWYRRYGVSMRPVPGTWEEFQRYWDRMCREVLVDTPAARRVLDLSALPPPPFLRWLPAPLWAPLRRGLQRWFVWLTAGLYDEPVRELLGCTWTERDARRHRRFGRAVEHAFRLVPRRWRKHPRARDGIDRVSGRVRPEEPVLHTPERNLPPESERDEPRHYCPVHASRRAGGRRSRERWS
ncbi:oxygenase MpaB family protein [Salinifilum ghardaiensis]